MKTLHILNGDGTAKKFEASSIEDNYIIWRECLFEGPVAAANEYEFWENRKKYITATYGIKQDEYDQKVLEELHKFHYCQTYDAFVLWFEFDLFCQVNLLYLLSWLATKEFSNLKIYLIAIDHYPGIADFRGMGQLSPQQLEVLNNQRQELTPADLAFAHDCWQTYTANDPFILEKFLERDFISFPLLKAALLAHLERFPSVENGLNRMEQRIFEIAYQDGLTKEELFEKFWQTESIYGLGDWQILNYLYHLGPRFVRINKHVKLTEIGKRLFKQEIDVFDYIFIERWLGGVFLSKKNKLYRWNKIKEKLEEDIRFYS